MSGSNFSDDTAKQKQLNITNWAKNDLGSDRSRLECCEACMVGSLKKVNCISGWLAADAGFLSAKWSIN